MACTLVGSSKTSGDSLFPCVLVTRVLPMFLTENIAGAFTSYQSFFVKGSTLKAQQGREDGREIRQFTIHCVPKPWSTWNGACLNKYLPQSSGTQLQSSLLITLWNLQTSIVVRHNFQLTHIFFLAPFLPFVNRLFFPTAILRLSFLLKRKTSTWSINLRMRRYSLSGRG